MTKVLSSLNLMLKLTLLEPGLCRITSWDYKPNYSNNKNETQILIKALKNCIVPSIKGSTDFHKSKVNFGLVKLTRASLLVRHSVAFIGGHCFVFHIPFGPLQLITPVLEGLKHHSLVSPICQTSIILTLQTVRNSNTKAILSKPVSYH